MKSRRLVAGGIFALVLLVLPAAAHEESAAAALRPDVVEVGHAPAVVRDGEQFEGWIVFHEGTAVRNVSFQVCVVDALTCILGQRPARLDPDGRTWRFDTAEERAPGADRPPHWAGGSRVGVQWFLEEGNGTTEFPAGTPMEDPSCSGAGAVACFETHYFAFDVAGAPRESPAVPATLLLGVLAALASVRRSCR